MVALLVLLFTLHAPASLAPFGLGCDGTADALKELRAAYKAKDTATAVRIFDSFTGGFEAMPAKDQDDVVKAVEAAFTSRRDEGDDVDQLYIAAGASLANMGSGGAKALLRALTVKHLRARPGVLATLVEGLGQQDDPAMVPELLKWLRPEKPLGIHSGVVAGAARALSRYREADPKLRKQAVGELVAVYVDYDKRARDEREKKGGLPEVETAFQQIETPLLLTLRTLSGEKFERADEWTKWWATAKDADWSGGTEAPPAKKKSGGPPAAADANDAELDRGRGHAPMAWSPRGRGPSR